MLSQEQSPARLGRSLVVLGRVSNLPTVWSNCLAGWILGQGGSPGSFLALGAGASLLYVGGMYLNDAFDVDFDRQHRPDRPIPSGHIAPKTVWRLGLTSLVLGTLTLMSFGGLTALLAPLLAVNIVLYDAVHKAIRLGPLLMAACRVLLFLLAASATRNGISGLSIWMALALGAYVAGVSFLARGESRSRSSPWWPLTLLVTPALLALVANAGPYLDFALGMLFVLAAWYLVALGPVYRSRQASVGTAVAKLLAGIVLIDLLAAGPDSLVLTLLFVLLFVLTLLLQRWIPAT